MRNNKSININDVNIISMVLRAVAFSYTFVIKSRRQNNNSTIYLTIIYRNNIIVNKFF